MVLGVATKRLIDRIVVDSLHTVPILNDAITDGICFCIEAVSSGLLPYQIVEIVKLLK